MNKNKILIFLLLFLPLFTHAQRYELGFESGIAMYKGDIEPDFDLSSARPTFSVVGKYNIRNEIAMKLTISGSVLSGSDKNSKNSFYQARGFSFSTISNSILTEFEYNFFNFRDSKTKGHFSPFLSTGLGIGSFVISNSPYFTSKKPFISPLIPLSVGINKALSDKINLSLEYKSIFTFTDNLDGLVSSEPFSKFKYFNQNDKDSFRMLLVGLRYRFISVKCPDHLH